MTTKDYGPAFPVNTGAECNPGAYTPDCGMTLRDYFAVHAPPVPNYYRLKSAEPIPREPDGYYDSMSPCTQSERDAYIDKREAIVNSNELERVLSWPWFYADRVLGRRGK